jgi:hypothetical protein
MTHHGTPLRERLVGLFLELYVHRLPRSWTGDAFRIGWGADEDIRLAWSLWLPPLRPRRPGGCGRPVVLLGGCFAVPASTPAAAALHLPLRGGDGLLLAACAAEADADG